MKTVIILCALAAVVMSAPQERVQVAQYPGGVQNPDPSFYQPSAGSGIQKPNISPVFAVPSPQQTAPGYQQPDISPAYAVPAPQQTVGYQRPDIRPAYVIPPAGWSPGPSDGYVQYDNSQTYVQGGGPYYKPQKQYGQPGARGGK